MDNIKKSWLNIFDNYNSEFSSNDKLQISNILLKLRELKKEYRECELDIDIFPKEEDIFRCFKYFEVNETNIVILGQDPYHGPNQATGLCFGISKNSKLPPSLKNIAKELKEDLNIDLLDFTFEKWAKQGILMLNASLSVIQGKPGSQMGLWNEFTKYIINELNNLNKSIIFVAWGAFAHEKLKNIDINKHHIIVSSHPSPLSVFKKYKEYPAFMGSKPFSKIKKVLEDRNESIEW